MVQKVDIADIELIHTSLMRALVALNGGKELTAEQLAFFKKAVEADDTWNQIKSNDLVPAKDMIALSADVLKAMGLSADPLTEQKDWRQLSSMQQALLDDFDVKLERITQILLTKADQNITPKDLNLTGTTKWEQLARDLLEKTIHLVREQRGQKPDQALPQSVIS